MGEVIRLTESPGDEDSWWVQGGGKPEEVPDQETDRAAELVPWMAHQRLELDGLQEQAIQSLGSALWDIVQATSAADKGIELAADGLTSGIDFEDAAGTIALIQDTRRRLQVVEQYLTKRLGEAATEVSVKGGTLPDGRPWEVRRGRVRKAWDHDAWKHDTRRAVVDEVVAAYGSAPSVIDEEGEIMDLPLAHIVHTALARAQEVHGSTAPRVGQLRALGMDPDEYAETLPGLWGFAVASPDTTTTEEK